MVDPLEHALCEHRARLLAFHDPDPSAACP
jgi:hypothetical protein